MPAYNEEKYVTKTINSLLDQSYKEWELIVIDDGSNDHTPEIVKQFADNDDRIRYFREQNSGQLTALSYGSQFVRGEIVTLLHSDDDLMDNNALARNVSLLTENKCDDMIPPYRSVGRRNCPAIF